MKGSKRLYQFYQIQRKFLLYGGSFQISTGYELRAFVRTKILRSRRYGGKAILKKKDYWEENIFLMEFMEAFKLHILFFLCVMYLESRLWIGLILKDKMEKKNKQIKE